MRAIEHLVEEESVIKKARMVDNVEEVPTMPVVVGVVSAAASGDEEEESKKKEIEEDANTEKLPPALEVEKNNEASVAVVVTSRDVIVSNPSSVSRRKLLVLDLNGLLADIASPLAGCKADINIGRRASESQKIFLFLTFCHQYYLKVTYFSLQCSVFKRPFCEEFLKFCFDKFEVGIWSSRKK